MNKYVNYERIAETFTKETLKEQFKEIVKNGWDIIYYNEKKSDKDVLHVVIVCGVPNTGVKEVL